MIDDQLPEESAVETAKRGDSHRWPPSASLAPAIPLRRLARSAIDAKVDHHATAYVSR